VNTKSNSTLSVIRNVNRVILRSVDKEEEIEEDTKKIRRRYEEGEEDKEDEEDEYVN
jgi:hypothetical protein